MHIMGHIDNLYHAIVNLMVTLEGKKKLKGKK